MKNVEVFENKRASSYDQFVDQWIPNYDYFIRQLPKLLEEERKELLVVGCGTGNEIESFTQSGNAWKITGIDPSPEMVLQAREKLKDYSKVELIDGVLEDLPASRKYGAATLLLVLHFLEDDGSKLNLLKEISKRIETGAPLIILDITGDQLQITKNLNILKSLLPENVSEDEIIDRLQRIQCKLHYVSEARLTDLLQEAGFEKPLRFFQTSIYMGWIARRAGN